MTDMNIINEILADLTKGEGSLEPALLKTKQLAYELNNQKLIDWTNCELKGYAVDTAPDYRKVNCGVYGSLTDGYTIYNHHQIPVLHLAKVFKEALTSHTLLQNITGLEHLVKEKGNDMLISPLPLEIVPSINKDLPLSGGYKVQTIQKEIPKSAVKEVLSNVRSNLLDFVLELKKEYGTEQTNNISEEKINQIMTTTIHAGDGSFINVGHNNTQNVEIKITKGSFEDLKNFLEKSEVDKDDIIELQTIIDNDSRDNKLMKLGDKANEWIKKVLIKSVDIGTKIGTGISAKLLADAIGKYYGWTH